MTTIVTRALGRDEPLVPSWDLPADDADRSERLRLRHFIERVVRREIGEYERRQHRRALRLVLTHVEINEGVARGRVASGDQAAAPAAEVDHAVAVALQGFVDGWYLVLIDGEEQSGLDEEVVLSPTTVATFLRLAPLSGG